MVKHLPAPLLSALTGLMLLINLLTTIVPFFAVTLAKFVVPLPAWRRRCSATLVHFGLSGISRGSD